jgi:hypothetical protein
MSDTEHFKDALLQSKDAVIEAKNALLQAKDAEIQRLQAELAAAKCKGHNKRVHRDGEASMYGSARLRNADVQGAASDLADPVPAAQVHSIHLLPPFLSPSHPI